jgi:hypothetical protein
MVCSCFGFSSFIIWNPDTCITQDNSG